DIGQENLTCFFIFVFNFSNMSQAFKIYKQKAAYFLTIQNTATQGLKKLNLDKIKRHPAGAAWPAVWWVHRLMV
ncbi:MAG: hypothetical protein NT126_00535, partial [Bacteroidetes bacterium]|nr:hypothetical protein [Bacteroidota bacterium]